VRPAGRSGRGRRRATGWWPRFKSGEVCGVGGGAGGSVGPCGERALSTRALPRPAGLGRRWHPVGARSTCGGSALSTRGVARATSAAALLRRQDESTRGLGHGRRTAQKLGNILRARRRLLLHLGGAPDASGAIRRPPAARYSTVRAPTHSGAAFAAMCRRLTACWHAPAHRRRRFTIMADRPHRVVVSGAAGAPASPTPPRPPRAASARRHPRLLLPLGGGRGSSFSRPARPGRYLQLDYPHGTGDARLGSRRTGAGRCARAVGGGVERAANGPTLRRTRRVVVCMRGGRCLCGARVCFFAANVRRMNMLLIPVLTTTRRPPTRDVRTTVSLSDSVPHVLQPGRTALEANNRRATRSTRHKRCRSRITRSQHVSRRSAAVSSVENNCRAPWTVQTRRFCVDFDHASTRP
jgi:hypothetical protein